MKVIKAEDTRSLEPFRDRIIEGDCLEVMKDIPGESIDMILCDLPYGTTQNKWDSIINLDLLFTEYLRIIKPHGAIVLTSSGLFTAKLMLHAPEIYKYKLIWVKSKATNFLNAKKQPLRKKASGTLTFSLFFLHYDLIYGVSEAEKRDSLNICLVNYYLVYGASEIPHRGERSYERVKYCLIYGTSETG